MDNQIEETPAQGTWDGCATSLSFLGRHPLGTPMPSAAWTSLNQVLGQTD